MNEPLEVGTWVRLHSDPHGFGSVGVIVRREPTYYVVQTDGTPASGLAVARQGFTVQEDQWAPHEFFPMRKKLPYGAYVCADGSRILFNRDHEPLLRRISGGSDVPCEPDERVAFIREQRFYSASKGPWRSQEAYMECVMILHGISEGGAVPAYVEQAAD